LKHSQFRNFYRRLSLDDFIKNSYLIAKVLYLFPEKQLPEYNCPKIRPF